MAGCCLLCCALGLGRGWRLGGVVGEERRSGGVVGVGRLRVVEVVGLVVGMVIGGMAGKDKQIVAAEGGCAYGSYASLSRFR